MRQGCPQGQSGGPFRVPVCLAHEGDLSPLSTAFHAAAGLAHATRNAARGIVRFGDGVGLPQGSWPATVGDLEGEWTRRAERRVCDGQLDLLRSFRFLAVVRTCGAKPGGHRAEGRAGRFLASRGGSPAVKPMRFFTACWVWASSGALRPRSVANGRYVPAAQLMGHDSR